MTQRSPAAFRVLEIILALVGLEFVLNLLPIDDLVLLGTWDALALLFLLAGGAALWWGARVDDREQANGSIQVIDVKLLDRFVWLLPGITSLVGITAAAVSTLVKADAGVDAATKLGFNVLGTAAMVFSWAILQTGFASIYERAYAREGGLRFPGTRTPRSVDFVYLAFTLGSSFATSDVEITSRRMRFRVLLHSVLSFFYNAAVVALAISVITGK